MCSLSCVCRRRDRNKLHRDREYLQANEPAIAAFNVIKGFLNLTIASSEWIELLNMIHADERYGIMAADADSPLVMIEYSSPNTNKPLHLGHVRNNLLGNALANIIMANGNKVVKTNIVNDRGIHICKSMLAGNFMVMVRLPNHPVKREITWLGIIMSLSISIIKRK